MFILVYFCYIVPTNLCLYPVPDLISIIHTVYYWLCWLLDWFIGWLTFSFIKYIACHSSSSSSITISLEWTEQVKLFSCDQWSTATSQPANQPNVSFRSSYYIWKWNETLIQVRHHRKNYKLPLTSYNRLCVFVIKANAIDVGRQPVSYSLPFSIHCPLFFTCDLTSSPSPAVVTTFRSSSSFLNRWFKVVAHLIYIVIIIIIILLKSNKTRLNNERQLLSLLSSRRMPHHMIIIQPAFLDEWISCFFVLSVFLFCCVCVFVFVFVLCKVK